MDTMGPLQGKQARILAGKVQQSRNEKYLEASRNRLDKIVSQKIRTSFIGALSAFEDVFGFLWGFNQSEKLTKEQEEMRQLWEKARHAVLNNGNTQLRAAQNEIANHIIEWNRYHTSFIFKGTN
jgi:hypothetical protein